MFLKLTPPPASTPTPLRSTCRGSSPSPQFLSFALSLFLSPPRLLPCSPVAFFFLSGERPVKSAVYYVFRSHPDKNTRHAPTTHSALSSYLSYRLASFSPFAPRFFVSFEQPDGSGFTTPGIFSRPRDFGSRGLVRERNPRSRSRGFKYLKTARREREREIALSAVRLVSPVSLFFSPVSVSHARASISYQTGPGFHRLTVKSRASFLSPLHHPPPISSPLPLLFAV